MILAMIYQPKVLLSPRVYHYMDSPHTGTVPTGGPMCGRGAVPGRPTAGGRLGGTHVARTYPGQVGGPGPGRNGAPVG